jgi:hypothetical protein
MKVKVYRNLHKQCWSVKHKQKVIARKYILTLSNATFKVSQTGRNRVLKEKKKNVHAFVCGELVEVWSEEFGVAVEVTYNPYKYDSFVVKATGEVIVSADYVIFKTLGECYAINPQLRKLT